MTPKRPVLNMHNS